VIWKSRQKYKGLTTNRLKMICKMTLKGQGEFNVIMMWIKGKISDDDNPKLNN
jgi:hypothetical protein